MSVSSNTSSNTSSKTSSNNIDISKDLKAIKDEMRKSIKEKYELQKIAESKKSSETKVIQTIQKESNINFQKEINKTIDNINRPNEDEFLFGCYSGLKDYYNSQGKLGIVNGNVNNNVNNNNSNKNKQVSNYNRNNYSNNNLFTNIIKQKDTEISNLFRKNKEIYNKVHPSLSLPYSNKQFFDGLNRNESIATEQKALVGKAELAPFIDLGLSTATSYVIAAASGQIIASASTAAEFGASLFASTLNPIALFIFASIVTIFLTHLALKAYRSTLLKNQEILFYTKYMPNQGFRCFKSSILGTYHKIFYYDIYGIGQQVSENMQNNLLHKFNNQRIKKIISSNNFKKQERKNILESKKDEYFHSMITSGESEDDFLRKVFSLVKYTDEYKNDLLEKYKIAVDEKIKRLSKIQPGTLGKIEELSNTDKELFILNKLRNETDENIYKILSILNKLSKKMNSINHNKTKSNNERYNEVASILAQFLIKENIQTKLKNIKENEIKESFGLDDVEKNILKKLFGDDLTIDNIKIYLETARSIIFYKNTVGRVSNYAKRTFVKNRGILKALSKPFRPSVQKPVQTAGAEYQPLKNNTFEGKFNNNNYNRFSPIKSNYSVLSTNFRCNYATKDGNLFTSGNFNYEKLNSELKGILHSESTYGDSGISKILTKSMPFFWNQTLETQLSSIKNKLNVSYSEADIALFHSRFLYIEFINNYITSFLSLYLLARKALSLLIDQVHNPDTKNTKIVTPLDLLYEKNFEQKFYRGALKKYTNEVRLGLSSVYHWQNILREEKRAKTRENVSNSPEKENKNKIVYYTLLMKYSYLALDHIMKKCKLVVQEYDETTFNKYDIIEKEISSKYQEYSKPPTSMSSFGYPTKESIPVYKVGNKVTYRNNKNSLLMKHGTIKGKNGKKYNVINNSNQTEKKVYYKNINETQINRSRNIVGAIEPTNRRLSNVDPSVTNNNIQFSTNTRKSSRQLSAKNENENEEYENDFEPEFETVSLNNSTKKPAPAPAPAKKPSMLGFLFGKKNPLNKGTGSP
jgi:hypothetical protein